MKLSFEEIRSKIYELVKALATGPETYDSWIVSLYEDEVVYQVKGKYYQAPYSINEKGEAALGDSVEVVKETKYKPVFSNATLFSAFSKRTSDGMVIRKGKIFEAGNYPDKGVAFDDADLETAARHFSPVENDIEHGETILDGKIGRLESVEKKGSELFGELSIPEWLDKVIGEEPLKVSLAFDRQKRIVGNALVLRPRIKDAAVMSAFTLFSSNPEPGDKGPGKNNMKKTLAALLSGLGIKTLDPNAEVTIPANMVSLFSEADPTPTPAPDPKPEADPTQAPTLKVFTALDPEVESRLKAIEASSRAIQEGALSDRSLVFAENLVKSGKILPAQADDVAGLFRTAVKADAGEGSFFGEDNRLKTDGANVKALETFFSNAPTVKVLGEQIGYKLPAQGDGAVFADSSERESLLSMTDLGRQVLEASRAK